MSKLEFDGASHQITLYAEGRVIGRWVAYNNVDSHATLTHVSNGVYTVLDRRTPRRHVPDANGPYGSYGIVRFAVPGHPGIGVHSGRALARRMPGPQHATMGCIRTSDEAMSVIVSTMRTSPLTTLSVVRNSPAAAAHASRLTHTRSVRGNRA